jgi:hypothetical protein
MSENNGNIRDEIGRFTNGNPGKPKGAASNASAKVKNAISKFLEDNIEKVQESFDTLKPIEKLQFIANILPYAVPKMSSIQSENETNLKGVIKIEWGEPDLPDPKNQGSNGELQSFQGGVPDNSEPRGN